MRKIEESTTKLNNVPIYMIGMNTKVQYWKETRYSKDDRSGSRNSIMMGLVSKEEAQEIMQNARNSGLFDVYDNGHYFLVVEK